MGRPIRIEWIDGAGKKVERTVQKNNAADIGSIFLSLDQAAEAYKANKNKDLTPELTAAFQADGVIVHDEECNWW